MVSEQPVSVPRHASNEKQVKMVVDVTMDIHEGKNLRSEITWPHHEAARKPGTNKVMHDYIQSGFDGIECDGTAGTTDKPAFKLHY